MSQRDPFSFFFGPPPQESNLPIEKCIRKAQAAAKREDVLLAAAREATPQVAAMLLEQCQLAHLEAASYFGRARDMALQLTNSIKVESRKASKNKTAKVVTADTGDDE